MRNKRLIILLSVLGGIAVLIVIMSAVFTVYHVEARCLSRYSDQEEVAAVSAEVVKAAEDEVKYRNIFLFDEEELLERVNLKVLRAEAVDVECKFPNTVQVKYDLVSEDVQIKAGDGYLVAGSGGKIIISDEIDRTDSSGSEYIDSLISVTPYASPENSQAGRYLYNDKNAYDLQALYLLIEYSSALVEPGSDQEVFRPSSIKSIDLSSTSIITVEMKSGVTFKLNSRTSARFDQDVESLENAVKAMVGWYIDADRPEEEKSSGTATVSYSDAEQAYTVAHK